MAGMASVNSKPFDSLTIPDLLYEEMLEHARSELPNECCGFLCGTIGTDRVAIVVARAQLVNEAASPTEFRSEPRSTIAALRWIDRAGQVLLAVYHSHPSSAPIPSRKDLRDNYDERVMSIIVGVAGSVPEVRGWWLDAAGYSEAAFAVLEWEPDEMDLG